MTSSAEPHNAVPKKDRQHFPFKLYEMLDYAGEHGAAVAWVKGGRAFAIHDKEAFLEHVVPKFFNQTKFRSFTRQLNLWGFTRLSKDAPNGDRETWKHELFVRGRADRLGSIRRSEIGKGRPRAGGRCRKEIWLDGSVSASIGPSVSHSYKLDRLESVGNGPSASHSFVGQDMRPVPKDVDCDSDTFAQPPVPSGNSLSHVQEFPTLALQAKYPSQACTGAYDQTRGGLSSLSPRKSDQDDFLFRLSSIIESDQVSRADDLSSILSLDEARCDLAAPSAFEFLC